MTTLTIHSDPRFSFIENGLHEIFGSDIQKTQNEIESLNSLLITLKETSTKLLGNAETAGLYLRAGRAAFYYWVRQFSDDLGWQALEFRLLPQSARIKRALTGLLAWMKTENFLDAKLSDSPDKWQISVTGLTGSQARLDCNFFTGMLQELCCWAGGGKFYPARESQCQAAGDPCCVFMIRKQPAV